LTRPTTARRRISLRSDIREVFRPRGYPTWRGYAGTAGIWILVLAADTGLAYVLPGSARWIALSVMVVLVLIVVMIGFLVLLRPY
jgi:membrane protein YdbS with pleckstrin-like domain